MATLVKLKNRSNKTENVKKSASKCHELLSNTRCKRHGLLLLTLVYNNNVKLVAIPGLSRDQFYMARYG